MSIEYYLHNFKGIFRKGHVHDLTGRHGLTGNLGYDDFFRKNHAPLYMTFKFQLFIRFMNDANKDVRNNAIFGLGELALNAGPGVMVQHYPTILQTLSNHLSKGDEARCVDQIVGAVCR